MDSWTAEMGKVREEKKKKDPGVRKGRKVAKHSVFPMICGSGGSKSRLAKAGGAEPSGQQKRWDAWDMWRGSGTMHLRWQGQYKRIQEAHGASPALRRWFLCDRHSMLYDLAVLVRGRRSSLNRWNGKSVKRSICSSLKFPFLKEVLQKCFVFGVVNLENWGSFAELQNCFL